MREWLLPLLACPGCHGALVCEVQQRGTGGIEEGLLRCQCGESYPVVGGVPRMLPGDGKSRRLVESCDVRARESGSRAGSSTYALIEQDVTARTREGFGFEWTTFRGMRPEWQSNFETYMAPMRKDFFRGQLVLDAGCGMGRHMFHAAEGGARVVGVDFSRAVEAAHENTKHFETAAVVQADVMRLPFRPGTFDFVYCLGVLHHLPHPLEALRCLVDVVRNRGECRIYVYHQIARVPRWKHALFRLASMCRRVSTRLPYVLLLAACWLLSAAIWVGCVVPYRLLRRYAPNAAWGKSWLFRQYAPYPFMVLVNDEFDRFSAPIERRYTRDEVEELMGAAGLRSIVVRESFGWIGHGLKCDEVSSASPAGKEASGVI